MKIYNEIVIDMNPESSSYGKTLHEDSFDYEGDMMKALEYDFNQDGVVNVQDIAQAPSNLRQLVADSVLGTGGGGGPSDLEGQRSQVKQGKTWKYIKKEKVSGSYQDVTDTSQPGISHEEWSSLSTGQKYHGPQGDDIYQRVEQFPIYEYQGGAWVDTGELDAWDSSGSKYTTYDDATQLPGGQFTYSTDESGQAQFDPTSQEFQTSVQETGGFGELITGFGLQDYESYFDPINMDELGFIEQEQSLAIKQGQLATAGAQETRRAATSALDIAAERNLGGLQAAEAQYGRGRRGAGQAVGQSLYAASQQQQEQASRSGFAGGGGGGGRAQRGIMADYNLQQEELAAGFAGAKSAFDITGREITSGRTATKSAYDIATGTIDVQQQQSGIDYMRGKSQFWDAAEEDFYGQLTTVEGLK